MVRRVCGLLALWVSQGCASQSAAYQQQIEVLQDKILILQSEGERFEARLAALEARESTPDARRERARSASGPATQPEAPPDLQVITLTPSDSGAPEAPEARATQAFAPDSADDEAPIRIVGTGAELATDPPGASTEVAR